MPLAARRKLWSWSWPSYVSGDRSATASHGQNLVQTMSSPPRYTRTCVEVDTHRGKLLTKTLATYHPIMRDITCLCRERRPGRGVCSHFRSRHFFSAQLQEHFRVSILSYFEIMHSKQSSSQQSSQKAGSKASLKPAAALSSPPSTK